MVSGSGKKHLSSVFLIQHFFDIGLGLGWASLIAQLVKNPAVQETRVQFLGQEDPLEKEMQPTPGFLPGKSHGQRSLTGYSPWGCKSQTRPSNQTTTTRVRLGLGLGLGASQVALVEKNLPVDAGDMRCGFDPWDGKIPWGKAWQPTPVFLPGKSHGWRSLVDYSPWGRKESDTTERLHFHFLSYIEKH